jgi:hypothetical protein
LLWKNKDELNVGHAIVVTGVEYNRLTGKVLGYYVNDSGLEPPSRGKFIPVDQFLKAWHEDDSQIVEVQ